MREYKVEVGGKKYNVRIVEDTGSSITVDVNGTLVRVELTRPEATTKTTAAPTPKRETPPAPTPQQAAPAPAPAPTPAAAPTAPAPPATGKTITAKVPGKIIKVLVKPGDQVNANQTVLTMESMKMEIEVKSPVAGRVADVRVKPGEFVNTGDVLIVLE